MKILLFLVLVPLSVLSQGKMIVFLDQENDKPVNGVQMEVRRKQDNLKDPKVPNGEINLAWDKNKTVYNEKIYHYDNTTYTKVTKHGYFDSTLTWNDLEKNNYTVRLRRNKFVDDFYIKLCTTKRRIPKAELQKIKSEIDVVGIDEIKRKDGKYAYITSKTNDLHLTIEQLKRINEYKNPFAKGAYILHEKNQRVYFKLQFGDIAKRSLENEIPTYRQMLTGIFKIDPIITSDKFYRIVTEKTYNNYVEAKKDYMSKVLFQQNKLKVLVLAYEKVNDKIVVISQLKI